MEGGLGEVADLGRLVGPNLVSVASSLSRVYVLGQDVEMADEEDRGMPYGMIELGMGIHNEPGCQQIRIDLPGIVQVMLKQLLDQNDKDTAYLKIDNTDKTVMLINNFGGLGNLELGAITSEVWRQLTGDWGIHPVRLFQAVYNGSLNGLGFGITPLKLVDTGLGEGKSLLELIDAPAEGVGWPQAINIDTWSKRFGDIKYEKLEEEIVKPSSIRSKFKSSDDILNSQNTVNLDEFTKALTAGLKRIIAAEPLVTRYDSIVGDGDCGVGLKRGAEAVLASL